MYYTQQPMPNISCDVRLSARSEYESGIQYKSCQLRAVVYDEDGPINTVDGPSFLCATHMDRNAIVYIDPLAFPFIHIETKALLSGTCKNCGPFTGPHKSVACSREEISYG